MPLNSPKELPSMLRQLLYRIRQSRIYQARVERAKKRRFALEIAASKIFDQEWYLQQNPEVRAAGLDPIDHYLRVGSRNGRNPNPLFDSTWYCTTYPDVGASGIDPFLHYLRYGGFEGRDPNPLFDSDWYLAQNPDVAAARINPLSHYILDGAASGLSPNPIFKSRWYVEQNPEIHASGANPLAYYLANALTTNPNPWFDGKWYLRRHMDVAAAKINPLAHYIREGAALGWAPSPLFKGRWYLENVPDLLVREDQRVPDDAAPPSAALGSATADNQRIVDIVAIVPGAARDKIERLRSPHSSPSIGTVTIIPVSLSDTAPTSPFIDTVAAARAAKRHLLVLLCDVDISVPHIEALVDAFDADPLIGYVVPRHILESGRLMPLRPVAEPGALADYDQRILGDVPPSQIVPEFLSCCFLIRRDLVRNFPDLAADFDTAVGALRALMTWGRRVGFRALIVNTISVPLEQASACYPALGASDQARLVKFFPDSILADAQFRALACHHREALLGRARSSRASERYQILFDCSGMAPIHNGTNECALGILDGIALNAGNWSVTIFATEEAISFHGIRERYKDLKILSAELTGTYTVAVRLSQPWAVQSIADLHRRALRIVVLMLDTIAWDIVYAANPEVELAWAMIAAHADAILYISEFTKNRFNFRFPVAPHVRQMVTHLSCHYDEYVSAAERRSSTGGHVLVIGNDMEHKGLTDTLELLPRAFPELQFMVVGPDTTRQTNVRALRSGEISADQMDAFFATARMLVFPSFYEGFGLPVVKGLGYGLDVVARRSGLLAEIGSNCAPRGRLIPFDDNASLVAVIRNVLAGADIETISMGTALSGAEPTRWKDVARQIVALADTLAADPLVAVHDDREAVLRFAQGGSSS